MVTRCAESANASSKPARIARLVCMEMTFQYNRRMRIYRWLSFVTLCSAALAQTAREPGLYARFETTMGNITVRLYEAEAPVTVKNFVALAEGKKAWKDPKTGQQVTRPLYDGVIRAAVRASRVREEVPAVS